MFLRTEYLYCRGPQTESAPPFPEITAAFYNTHIDDKILIFPPYFSKTFPAMIELPAFVLPDLFQKGKTAGMAAGCFPALM